MLIGHHSQHNAEVQSTVIYNFSIRRFKQCPKEDGKIESLTLKGAPSRRNTISTEDLTATYNRYSVDMFRLHLHIFLIALNLAYRCY
jgi:hypothetical protein